MPEDENLLKSFLKKQIEIHDKFLLDFTSHQVLVDTKELKSLVDSYKSLVDRAENLRPNIDTSRAQIQIFQAVHSALESAKFTPLIETVNAQIKAIERNNLILEQGTGRVIKWWITIIIALFFFGAGWAVNWYFEIPQQVVGVNRYKVLQMRYDDINNTLGNDCTLAKRYYKDKDWEWHSTDCNYTDSNGNLITVLPLKTSDSIISGH